MRKILVPVKRVVDYNVKIRVKADGSGVDTDGDGLRDLLVAYGGFTSAPPHQTDRPPGRLLVVRSRNGETLAEAPMPDGRETYMSPVVHDFDGDGSLSVLFGTGGETINGHFYKAELARVLEGDLSGATVLADGPVTLGFRAEDATVADSAGAQITAPIYTIELLGDATMLTVRAGGAMVAVKAAKDYRAEIGDPVSFAVPAPITHLFDAGTGARIAGA